MLGSSIFERWFSRKSKLVFDFDDAIWRNQTGDIRSTNAALMFLKNPKKTIKIIECPDLVFAGNQFLYDYAIQWNSNVQIVPTTIDTNVYKVVSKVLNDKTCIGWSLIESFETRIRIGLQGRETVEKYYSVDVNQHLYLNSFKELIS